MQLRPPKTLNSVAEAAEPFQFGRIRSRVQKQKQADSVSCTKVTVIVLF